MLQRRDSHPSRPTAPGQTGAPRRASIPAQRSSTGPWQPRVSVIIPTYNEARNLPYVFERMPADVFEIIVVDGRSTDDTILVAQQLCPHVRIVKQTRTGKGNALACGFAAVLGDIAVTVDADGSADPQEIPRFVDALMAGADYAKGTRFANGGGSADITGIRRLGNLALTGLVNRIYRTRHSDLCYGYNAIWAHHLPVFDLDADAPAPTDGSRLWGDGFEIETLMTLRVLQAGLRVAEVPSYEALRLHGSSNLNAVTDGIRVLRTIGRAVREDHQAAPPVAATGQPSVIPAQAGPAALESAPANWTPMAMADADLDRPLPRLHRPFSGAPRTRVLARLHGHPLGQVDVDVPAAGLAPSCLATMIWAELGHSIRAHLDDDGLDVPERLTAAGLPVAGLAPRCLATRSAVLADAPHITVVIATRDRTDSVLRTLRDLAHVDYPHYDVLVVDSAPADHQTARAIRDMPWFGPQLRYLRLAEPGLAVAHNAALPYVQGEWVAFTDDDVQIDPQWLTAMAEGIRSRPDVGCVTGLLLPAELETYAQELLEQFGGYARGFAGHTWTKYDTDQGPLFPFAPGRFGSGANMAFRLSALQSVGGFDPATGAGTPARGGDDLIGFLRVLRAGYALTYRPDAVIRHHHHRDGAALRRQLHGYGVGLGAYLASTALNSPSTLPEMARRIAPAARHLLARDSAKNRVKSAEFPAELNRVERQGLLHGPVAYLRSRRVMRTIVPAEIEVIATGSPDAEVATLS